MKEEKLNLFLMGKTGHGKSCTGNMLLNRTVFDSSADASSKTQDVNYSFSLLLNFLLMVIDGPGLVDTGKNKAGDKEAIVKSTSTALSMCHEGIDAFLFVIRFGIRLTDEEVSVLDALKRLLGDGYLDRMIVVVTFGTSFSHEMEDKNLSWDFPTWCRNQEGAFRELYKSCRGRFVLVENREKDIEKRTAQRMEIANEAARLKHVYGRYSCQSFEQAKSEREKFIVENKALILKDKIQEDLILLVAEIEQLSETSAELPQEKIKDRVRELLGEIDETDQGHGLLEDLRGLVVSVEQSLENKLELKQIGVDLDNLRRAKEEWFSLSARTVFYPVVGAVVGVSALIGTAVIGAKEKKLIERQETLKQM